MATPVRVILQGFPGLHRVLMHRSHNMVFTQGRGFVVRASFGLQIHSAPLSRSGLPRRGQSPRILRLAERISRSCQRTWIECHRRIPDARRPHQDAWLPNDIYRAASAPLSGGDRFVACDESSDLLEVFFRFRRIPQSRRVFSFLAVRLRPYQSPLRPH